MISRGKKYNNQEATTRLERYCAYQERCHRELDEKLQSWGFPYQDRAEVIVRLIERGFLNEERFARAYVRGKFRQKQWGRMKIRQGLKQKFISDKLISMAMEEIDEQDYVNTLKSLIDKKTKLIKEKNAFIKNQKLAQYVYSKGFETELFWDLIRE